MTSNNYQPLLDDLGVFKQKSRNVVAALFGSTWNTLWAQAGFINHTTSVPGRIEEKLGLAVNLAIFFAENPSYEQPNLGVTKAAADLIRTNTQTAQQAVAAATLVVKNKGIARDAAYVTLTTTMRLLINTLKKLIKGNDPLWLAFGLNMPDADVTPSQPINVTASVSSDTDIITVQCDPVALAMRYRARMLLVGVETEYRLVASGTEPMLPIGGVVPGQTAEIVMEAVNGSAQGVPSQPVQVTVPLPVTHEVKASATTPVSAAPSIEEAIVSANGNGSHNGHSLY